MPIEIILGALGDAVFTHAGSKGFGWLKSFEAKREMASIAADSLEVAAQRVPALANDIRSASFANGVLAPMVKALVDDPSQLPCPEQLADQYVVMFVERFAKQDGADTALRRIFQTERTALKAAFVAFLSEFRSRLNQSKHWRELAHFAATEATLKNSESILSILDQVTQRQEAAAIDLDEARQDARSGSDDLRGWPRAIVGQELERPELARLKSEVLAKPNASTLLIGEAGSGKSALLAKLTEELESEELTVFGIKADTLPPDIATFDDLARALGMTGAFLPELSALARHAPVVLIIDQLDAVSDVMDGTSQRMRVLLRLVRQVREQQLPVHVVVSSRPFEAAHDARFQQLSAQEFTLELPSIESVQTFLTGLQIDWVGVSEPLWKTLRRPFALKLFVDLIQRGVSPDSIDSGSLLDRWLATAQLGSDSQRQEVLQLMNRLASEMLETETLWRPIGFYEAANKEALARAEACGLVVRNNGKIGFCHQSWLDDFQARGFSTGNDLVDYVRQNQDSLFIRATVLRSLERLRQDEPQAYRRSVIALLWGGGIRRHVMHLVVDVVATSTTPGEQEGAWIQALIESDPILATRALGQTAARWEAWRELIRHCIARLMRDKKFHWRATQLLAAEAKTHPDYVVELIEDHWTQSEHDHQVVRVAEQSGALTPAFEKKLREILNRTVVDRYSVSELVTKLRGDRRYAEACRLVGLWFDAQGSDDKNTATLHDIDKLAKEAPREFAEALLPRFVAVAEREIASYREGYKRFPKSRGLRWEWYGAGDPDRVLRAFRKAMKALAVSEPEAALALVQRLEVIQIDQVQDVAAQTLLAGAATLAPQALAFLLSDERRLEIGDASVSLEPGCMSAEIGLTSQELVEAISSQLCDDDVVRLRDYIKAWSVYGPEMSEGEDPKMRLQRMQWAHEHRLKLLERIPDRFLSARELRQVKEWRIAQRWPIPKRESSLRMATLVGSPMSDEKMLKARDEDLFRILDEINDETTERSRRRPLSIDGGVTQLSQAFGAFAKQQPERAIALCKDKFVAGRHEHAAAHMIDELSSLEEYPANRLLELIHELSEIGFNSSTWRSYASRALARLSRRLSGLPDATIEMLESWLENDPEAIANKIERRLELEAENERANARDRAVPEPMIFASRGLGGLQIVPHDNYPVLDAIFHGFIGREQRAFDQWLALLERHAARPEDPHTWSFYLLSNGRWLYDADRERVRGLLAQLWITDNRVFLSVDLGGTLWSIRAMVPDDLLISVIKAWSAEERHEWRQSAAEIAEAFQLVEPSSAVLAALGDLLVDVPSPELTGRLFTAACAWRGEDAGLRNEAHALLMEFVSSADGDQAHAISSAVDRTDALQPDQMTKELILKIADNDAVLGAALNGRFADGLQSLLLFPGFDEPVLQVTERIANLVTDKGSDSHPRYIDKDFVQVAIALQRSDGPIRARAMDVYEQLLDAGAYGAEEAAEDVLIR